MFILEACVFATVLCGFFGIVLKRNLIMKILSMDVMSTGVIGYYVLVSSRSGSIAPIAASPIATSSVTDAVDLNAQSIAYADPVPQAVILTAIVIGFSVQALMLVGVMKLSRDNPTLEAQEVERSNTP